MLKYEGWVSQEVTLICIGRSSPVLDHSSGVSKLLNLERGRWHLSEPLYHILFNYCHLDCYSLVCTFIHNLEFILWQKLG